MWLVANAADDVLTCDDETSDAGKWRETLLDAVMSFEEVHFAAHGYYPLNASPGEWMGPVGHA